MSWDLLDEPGAWVTVEQHVRLYALLIAALDDEAIASHVRCARRAMG